MANPTLAAEMRAALARQQRSQSWLAAQAQISKAALSRKMRGETDFTVPELIQCASALGISAASLIEAAA
ncbi:helix-turn-helix protein [Propionicimonas paludicola]|uniref:Helix-turn-helix protein n=1 Tax=Propionicimonas paludicola TaxID=185243 RepID=A0A2A9CS37_9ACTN|nr:helix-turn-helix transcriptional regulator [Propionicimonas paludicola]PFG17243.1 helix-turn-helix protein [Propionicimonas paludicola]